PQHVLEQDRLLRQALGARGADVVVADLVEEERAVEPRRRRQRDEDGEHHRQRHVLAQVRRDAVAPALDREEPELEREHVLADDDVDEERDRQRHRRQHHDRAVGERAAHVGDAERERDREQRVEDEDRDHHRQRRRQARREQVRDRLVGRPTAAPVEGDDLLEEDAELHPDRLVQAELLADRLDLRLGRVEAAEDLGRVAAETLEEEEHEKDDAEQRRHHLPEASDQVGGHRRKALLVVRRRRRAAIDRSSGERESRASAAGARTAFARHARRCGDRRRRAYTARRSSIAAAVAAAALPSPLAAARLPARGVAALALLALFACAVVVVPGAGALADAPAGGTKVLRYALRVAETGFDPAQISDLYSSTMTANMFDALYEYAFLARPVRLRPNTATAMPEASDDFKTFTIHIKPGIYFSDDPALGDKKPFDDDAPVAGLVALDRYTLRFQLAQPNPRFADELSDPARTGAVAREVVERYGDAVMEHPVGTGPYRLAQWRRSSLIAFEKNPNYREVLYDETAPADDPLAQAAVKKLAGKRLPLVDRVELSIIEQPQPRWLAFLNRESDVIEQVPEDFTFVAIPNNKVAPNLAKDGVYEVRYLRNDASMSYFAMEN